jgi:predicted SAM-dependent methyltransferase
MRSKLLYLKRIFSAYLFSKNSNVSFWHTVLKPNGIFFIKTPNKYHYIPLLGRITPLWFHKSYNKIRGRNEPDTFPTLYKANSKKTIEGLVKSTGFAVDTIERIEGRPEYLRITWPTYILGVCYEKAVNSTELFSNFRSVLIICLRKQARKEESTITRTIS